jgi:hypothetical protein
MDDEKRKGEAAWRMTEAIAAAVKAIQDARAETAKDGTPLCRRQFLQIAERHLDMARRYARSACGPPEEQEED